MKHLTFVVLGVAALAAGCGNNGNDGIGTNALGYYGDVNWDNAVMTGSGTTEANIRVNDDDSVTVQITEGPDAGETATFYADGSGGYFNDDVDAYLQLGYFDDPSIKDGPVVALIDVASDDENLTLMAFRSSNGMTAASDMPVTGFATYRGSHVGGAAIPGDYLGYIEGGFQANVDFGAGQLAGAMQSGLGDITFDATISGAEFDSNANSIAIDNDYGVINQGASGVEGGFYGEGAAGMAGTYLLNGQGPLNGAGAVGAFVADRD
ncbi:transferrin-binding protein-like solute binding protein [Martelella soudanensis]|uniref:transferrin-binding protein-like solute binding protein n=1 Tax=unclassified Martelella TaxID=2629616 RepID=UPI0015DDC454|nr:MULTISPECIES: transferrin-binding protein-like solute binding protein [unclassified Martelella]